MKEFEYTLPADCIADLPEAYKLKPKLFVISENLLGKQKIFEIPRGLEVDLENPHGEERYHQEIQDPVE